MQEDFVLKKIVELKDCGRIGCKEPALVCLIIAPDEEEPQCVHSCAMHLLSLSESIANMYEDLLKHSLGLEDGKED